MQATFNISPEDISELIDALDDVTASLENTLLQFGSSMYASDKASRWEATKRATALLEQMQLSSLEVPENASTDPRRDEVLAKANARIKTLEAVDQTVELLEQKTADLSDSLRYFIALGEQVTALDGEARDLLPRGLYLRANRVGLLAGLFWRQISENGPDGSNTATLKGLVQASKNS